MFPIETSTGDLLPFFRQEIARLVSATPSAKRPFFIHTLGGPGAGKTTFLRYLKEDLGNKIPFVAFDKLMEALPEYQACNDKKEGFEKYQMPARMAGYALLAELIAKGCSVLLEHSGGFLLNDETPRFQNVEMLAYAKTKGYSIMMVDLTTSLPVARERVLRRAKIEGRHVPLHYIDERHQVLQELIPHYRALADFFVEIRNEEEDETHASFKEGVNGVIQTLNGLKKKAV
jgi:predicted ABC-type ATPase